MGCATVPAQPPAAPAPTETPAGAQPATASEPEDLPPMLRGLDLTAPQIAEVLKMQADLRNKADTLASASFDFFHSVAGAARQCKGDTPFLGSDAERVVREAEEIREPFLDAAQKLHALLTPAQRQKLSDRLIQGNDAAKRERRNSARTRELGPQINLSTMQTVKLLTKAAELWSTYADKTDPWREQYRIAVVDFARDDFDVHKEPVAKAPVMKLALDFVRSGLRLIIPILEPQQCEALGKLIDLRVDEAADRWRNQK